MKRKTIITSFANFILLEDNIIIISYIIDGQFEVENAIEILKITNELSEGKKHSIIYDFNKFDVIFSQEIKQMAQNRNVENALLASRAFVCYSLSNKLESNHFIKFNKPSTPTKIFNSLEEAIAWTKSISI